MKKLNLYVFILIQVLRGNEYNHKCDVYSFGICLWEIYCCELPYSDMNRSEKASAVIYEVSSVCIYIYKLELMYLIHLVLYILAGIAGQEAGNTRAMPEQLSKDDEAVLG